ncbi:MAG: hypothetical protein IJ121_00600 [Eubacterium sp.]|nr:hypothetical protein [Eubacterium sp.]
MNEKRKALREKMLRENVMIIQMLLVIVFIVIFAVVNLVVPDRLYSQEENRTLAQRPQMSGGNLADGSYFTDLETAYSDQFVLRDKWVMLQANLARLTGRRELNGVYIGKKKYLLAKPAVPQEEQLTALTDAVNAFRTAHEKLNTQVMLVPDAANVLTDKLPELAPLHDQVADILDFSQRLDQEVVWLDAVTPLRAHASEDIYYRTDHHWTSAGAKYVFEYIAHDMGITSVLREYDRYVVSDEFEGTLAAKTGLHRAKDAIEVYTPLGTDVEYYVNYPDTNEKSTSMFHSEALDQKDQYTVFFGGNHPLVEIHTTADTTRSLLLFKDSYANSFVQFLYPYYKNIILIDPRYYYDNAEALISAHGITDVMILYSADTIFEDTALADCLNAMRY